MYAVIKTGGKQYRVRPGDVLVVEKLPGEPGARIEFDQVLMVGDGETATLGEPMIDGASVSATLIETRKGEKIKIFKKIRRHGYRRTRGHRQPESVLRVTAIAAGGHDETWDGEVSLTPRAELLLRSRGLASLPAAAALTPPDVDVETIVEPEGPGKSPRVRARVVETSESLEPLEEATAPSDEAAAEAPPAKPAKKKARAGGKPPTIKDVAKSGAPKATRAQAKAPPVRRSAPRGKG